MSHKCLGVICLVEGYFESISFYTNERYEKSKERKNEIPCSLLFLLGDTFIQS